MTSELIVGGVIDQCDVTIVTALRMSALKTEDARRESAAVEEQDRLPALVERLLDGAA